MPERYGSWATLHTRFRRWATGRHLRADARRACPGQRADAAGDIVVAGVGRLHDRPSPPARGRSARKGIDFPVLCRSKAATSKIHLACDGAGRPRRLHRHRREHQRLHAVDRRDGGGAGALAAVRDGTGSGPPPSPATRAQFRRPYGPGCADGTCRHTECGTVRPGSQPAPAATAVLDVRRPSTACRRAAQRVVAGSGRLSGARGSDPRSPGPARPRAPTTCAERGERRRAAGSGGTPDGSRVRALGILMSRLAPRCPHRLVPGRRQDPAHLAGHGVHHAAPLQMREVGLARARVGAPQNPVDGPHGGCRAFAATPVRCPVSGLQSAVAPPRRYDPRLGLSVRPSASSTSCAPARPRSSDCGCAVVPVAGSNASSRSSSGSVLRLLPIQCLPAWMNDRVTPLTLVCRGCVTGS
ncbi:hypothetical protein STENM223S_10845 [Streptomyces tendae]